MARVPCKICVTRFVGTFILRASSAALSPSSSSSSARCSPGWIAAIAMAILLVIIDNLHIRRPRRAAGPLEAHAPLIVVANAVLALAVATQRFKTVARQRGKIPKRRGRLQTVQLQARGTLDSREGLDALPARELSGPLIPIADDHSPNIAGITRYVKRIGMGTLLSEAGKDNEDKRERQSPDWRFKYHQKRHSGEWRSRDWRLRQTGMDFSRRRASFWCSSRNSPGRREPNLAKNSRLSARSYSQSSASTRKSSFSASGAICKPSSVSAVFVGTKPISVSRASPCPSMRSRIHFSTRTFSPKPGHRNLPSAPRRNQFTWKIFGGLGMRFPISSQCPK